MIILLCYSCKNALETDQLQSDESISLNLSNGGEVDYELLVGEWDLINFAYTKDGKKISDASIISKGCFTIPYVPTPIDSKVDERCRLDHTNSIWFICSIYGNLIKFDPQGSTYILAPQEENEIVEALSNVYSFVIKGNELIVYFTGVKNKNLLILKKR